ncbi:MAG: YggS family pyridoxal phosphate-dependent enzyme, partial [Gammaproteobacteria bacterium]|nr:YggS family pyridoxal phosphate-dependent enzyme [Alphaproteobacteria bacterium]NNM00383.1 YggS family pyridoxal phosphate-dependent enzyme [Gammaproteobacteria bacterium]
MTDTIAENLRAVRAELVEAAQRAGRDADSVTLLAVSKTHPIETVKAASAAGQRAFGENYVQEAVDKIAALAADPARPPLEWHFIGHLQSNKSRAVAEHFDWLQTLDSERLAGRLSRQRPADKPPLNVLIEVNISGEQSKHGVAPAEVADLAAAVAGLPGLKLRGLMAIPAAVSDEQRQRAAFAALRELQEALIAGGHQLDTLSMGMS